MKLQVKTLNQKSLVVEIDEDKTVYELKKELSLYPDVGVSPELQKLIYAGKILENEDKISSYNIDVKKFLVIMILKQPLPVPTAVPKKEAEEKKAAAVDEATTPKETKTTAASEAEFKTPTTPAAAATTPSTPAAVTTTPVSTNPETEAMVAQIVSMGYVEHDVRRALKASFNNPERAIEYLIEGIPTSPSTPEGDSYIEDTDADLSMTPFEVFRGDPVFHNLRSALQQHPELIDVAIQRIGETNPALLELISENQEEFLSMLLDGSDDDEEDDDEEDDE
ncbi:UV excision repair protein RAD23 homolog A-like [Musca vetustissima]|uniref:UV excision repair protein RAD23 homolog A-like n=1 Tax=Musca vetustissima TaxID=27455 RepID=UPI002AB7C7E0|nr:UV excision repair protein RAD23 homolog A-like [Musca vetustissima]